VADLMRASIVALACSGCARFDPGETIQLIPDSTWTDSQVETLAQAASCWNLRFGVQFEVAPEATASQVVNVELNDFTCLTSAGRFTPGQVAQIDLCPPAHWPSPMDDLDVAMFAVLVHELGHAAGIRDEGKLPESVMGFNFAAQYPPLLQIREAFTDEDRDLLLGATPDFDEAPTCNDRTVLVGDDTTGRACGCKISAPRRAWHSLVYDAARARVVMFGGRGSTPPGSATPGYPDDTWEWDGTAWTDVTPAISPPGRANAALAYDASREQVVLFGGSNETDLADTWVWNGSEWRDVSTPGPSPRGGVALAYDRSRGQVVLFGGARGATALDDTWIWDGATWTEVVPVAKPPPRGFHAMAYDPLRDRIVVFGGYDRGFEDDTWEWDGTTWRDVTPATSPAARGEHALVFDPVRRSVLLFGGYSDAALADTWEWGGTRWVELDPAVSPPARDSHALAFDTARGRAVLFGGYGGFELDDTWELDDTAWLQSGFRRCGDGVVQTGETCDDGGVLAGDGCSPTCQLE